ncbi:MAG: hypothetical protein ABIC04_00660 [Nanoarchaeota archaeon]
MLKRLCLGKKADFDLIMVLFQYALLLTATFIIWHYVDGQLSKTVFEQNFLAKDISLLTDAVYSAPSNVFTDYSYNKYNFLASFEKRINEQNGYYRTRIHQKDDLAFYPFAKNQLEPALQESLKLNDVITISKINNRLYTSRKSRENILKLECPGISTSDNSMPILIDPGQNKMIYEEGDDDLDYVNKNNIVVSLTELLVPPLGPLKNAVSTLDNGLRAGDIDNLINTKNPQIIINLRIGSYSNNINNIKAYYSTEASDEIKKKSEKLACLILNNVPSNLAISGTAIIPIIEDDYPKAILPKDRVAILIEIGNINSDKFQPEKIGNIKDAIFQGIKSYLQNE